MPRPVTLHPLRSRAPPPPHAARIRGMGISHSSRAGRGVRGGKPKRRVAIGNGAHLCVDCRDPPSVDFLNVGVIHVDLVPDLIPVLILQPEYVIYD